jgi:hypothetical protein
MTLSGAIALALAAVVYIAVTRWLLPRLGIQT